MTVLANVPSEGYVHSMAAVTCISTVSGQFEDL